MPTLRIRDASEDRYLSFDLQDLLRVLGQHAIKASWKCKVDECISIDGMDSVKLESEFNRPTAIKGRDLIQLAASTRQAIDGIFEGFEPGSNVPWVKLEAIDSSYWEVTATESVLNRFRDHFRNFESMA